MPTTLSNFVMEKRNKFHKEALEFRKTFNTPLRRFWDPLTGFDVVLFDDMVVKSDTEHTGKSTEDVVREKWGQPAVELTYRLI